jgi:nucleotide-binding universal stress UspA family protein
MFKKILVPVDLTDSHSRSLDIAAHLAGEGAEVTLLHVIELIAGLSRDEEKGFYGRLEREAREHLARLGRHLDARRVAWQSQVIYGSRGPEVLRHAQQAGSDLIVRLRPADRVIDGHVVIPPEGGHKHGPRQSEGRGEGTAVAVPDRPVAGEWAERAGLSRLSRPVYR